MLTALVNFFQSLIKSPQKSKMASPVAFNYHAKAQSTFKIPLLAGDNAYLGDLFSSDKVNPDKPMSAGLYRLEKGEPLKYTYTYDEMKIILEGDYTISDETGQEVKATPGDVFFFPKGATITFTTTNYGLAFYCGQRKESAF
ncbi:RmlC-like cupin domain-containing protein [Pseudomassariella vexata]|uniref:RmlC-like cupin domain-containing protein n=1 Tax=Pseudomassariella vexata TaxID=1141098 RepID=A0A1Y2DKA3_9PEZI|nr:RmlC-like cupin domain-containing protein [Pseudomassariella vexata]ORY59700.1 RmlC-like cupin domain-containing protein [Pseudomassariella vexata]